jgi:unsaturated chondroitin disaccharide hydrolase
MKYWLLVLALSAANSAAQTSPIAPPGNAGRNRAEALTFVAHQLEVMSAGPASKYPEFTTGGRWQCTDGSAWTAGYFAGMLWFMYGHTKDPVWRERARRWTEPIGAFREKAENLGVMFMPSFTAGYRLTGDDSYRQRSLEAAESLARRYLPEGKYIRYEAPGFLIIDDMIDLSLLYWAAQQTGQQRYAEIATNHTLATLNATVKADGRSLQAVELDPKTGKKIADRPRQGITATSCWSRGQAWAIYSLAEIYGYTRDERFRRTAEEMADWWIDRVPPDYVPYWDFDLPQIAGEPRDSSAAALTAGGLWELAKVAKEKNRADRYRAVAVATLDSLTKHYLAAGDPHEDPRILIHATLSKPEHRGIDESLITGDYYYLELLLKVMNAPPAPR